VKAKIAARHERILARLVAACPTHFLVSSHLNSLDFRTTNMKVYLWIQADDVEDSAASETFMRRVCGRLGAEVVGVACCYPPEDPINSFTTSCAAAEEQHAFIMSSNRELALKHSQFAAA
jgi:hypothetical protein